MFSFSETESLSESFEQGSYGGSNFIIGIGPMFLFMIGYAVFLVARLCYFSLTTYTGDCGLMQRFRDHNTETTVLRFVLEGNIDILIWSLISAININRQRSLGEHPQDVFSNLVAFVMLVVLLCAPVYTLRLAYKGHRLITLYGPEPSEQAIRDKELELERIKSVFEDFKQDLASMLYFPVFILRRMVLVATLVFLPDFVLFQIFLHILMSAAMLSYSSTVRPFEEPF